MPNLKRSLVAVGGGQAISILLALTGFISTNLTERSFNFPVLQSTGFYFLLSLGLLRRPFPLKLPFLLYLFVALLDVEANFLAVMAYQYTDITSILLLNSLTIPWTVILSYFVFKRKYNLKQLACISLCIAGLGLVIVSDSIRGRWDDSGAGSSAWIGDILCIGSSLLYASQNVVQEFILKKLPTQEVASYCEYLGMLGLVGFVISNIQWLVIERSDVVSSWPDVWTPQVIGLVVGFSLTMFVLYIILAWYIKHFDASVFNMNILTSGIYGIIITFIAGINQVRRSTDWLYILAYLLVVAGVVFYSLSERQSESKKSPKNLEPPLAHQ